MTTHIVDYTENKYLQVAATSVDTTGGTVIPNGETIFVSSLRLNGADPEAYVMLTWDWGGGSQKIIASTRGDIVLTPLSTNINAQFTGDGSKKIQIIIDNNNSTQTPFIGGEYELTKL